MPQPKSSKHGDMQSDRSASGRMGPPRCRRRRRQHLMSRALSHNGEEHRLLTRIWWRPLPAAAQTSSKSAPLAEKSTTTSSSLSCRSSLRTAATRLRICSSVPGLLASLQFMCDPPIVRLFCTGVSCSWCAHGRPCSENARPAPALRQQRQRACLVTSHGLEQTFGTASQGALGYRGTTVLMRCSTASSTSLPCITPSCMHCVQQALLQL